MVAIAIPAAEASAIRRALDSFVAPGATLDGPTRRRVCELSRSARSHGAISPEAALDELAVRLTIDAHGLREQDVAAYSRSGISAETYVEVLGVVARLNAVDTFCFGVGQNLPELPASVTGEPTRAISSNASIDGGWVPTVGPAWPPTALSLVPGEHEAMHELHGAFYLTIEGMADLDAHRGLHRTQMELVAARTSLLNECFF